MESAGLEEKLAQDINFSRKRICYRITLHGRCWLARGGGFELNIRSRCLAKSCFCHGKCFLSQNKSWCFSCYDVIFILTLKGWFKRIPLNRGWFKMSRGSGCLREITQFWANKRRRNFAVFTSLDSSEEMPSLLSIPLKKSQNVELVKPLSNYIKNTFSDEKLHDTKDALAELNQLRTNAVLKSLDKHETSLDVLQRF